MNKLKDKEYLVKYFRGSLKLQDPSIENDPDYIYEDEELLSILEMVMLSRDPSFTFNNLPEGEIPLIMILARKEVYWRLATSSAPYYPISAEGASLQKNARFNHYLDLIKQLEFEYEYTLSLGNHIDISKSQGELVIDSRYFSHRNKVLANDIQISLNIDRLTSDTIDISWEIVNLNKPRFYRYVIYMDNKPVVDFYEDEVVREDFKIKEFNDVKRNKARLKGLTSNTEYYIALEVREQNGIRAFNQIKVTTLEGEVI